jgi:hypothetical protein
MPRGSALAGPSQCLLDKRPAHRYSPPRHRAHHCLPWAPPTETLGGRIVDVFPPLPVEPPPPLPEGLPPPPSPPTHAPWQAEQPPLPASPPPPLPPGPPPAAGRQTGGSRRPEPGKHATGTAAGMVKARQHQAKEVASQAEKLCASPGTYCALLPPVSASPCMATCCGCTYSLSNYMTSSEHSTHTSSRRLL